MCTLNAVEIVRLSWVSLSGSQYDSHSQWPSLIKVGSAIMFDMACRTSSHVSARRHTEDCCNLSFIRGLSSNPSAVPHPWL